ALTQPHQQRPGDSLQTTALEISERARARSLLETLTETRANVRQGVDPALLEREHTLQQTLNAKAERQMQLLAGPHDAAQAQELAAEIEQLTTQCDEV